MIQIKDLTIGYQEKKQQKVIARQIEATIEAGELTCLLGTNGVGKSTLLRTLAAFQPKLGGSIWIQGKDLSQYSDRQLARLISLVLTEKCDIRNLSVLDLIGMGRSPYTGFWGVLSANDRVVIDQAITWIGIENLAHRMVHTLSDGERQKVMIAKALAQETPIILLDEPTAFLDFPSKVEMLLLLHRLSHEMHKTIFLSTHDLDLALQVADKLWLMHPSEGFHRGIPEDLALDGSLARYFTCKGVGFDEASGLFRLQFETHHSVSLHGTGIRTAMLQKALIRHGIATSELPTDYRIEVEPNKFLLFQGENMLATTSDIASLLEHLLPRLIG